MPVLSKGSWNRNIGGLRPNTDAVLLAKVFALPQCWCVCTTKAYSLLCIQWNTSQKIWPRPVILLFCRCSWPDNADVTCVQQEFFSIAGFPGVVGAIDGTRVRVQARSTHEDAFNRHLFHSLNVQLVVDAMWKIINVVSYWSEGIHDSRILRESAVRRKFADGTYTGLVVGDCAIHASLASDTITVDCQPCWSELQHRPWVNASCFGKVRNTCHLIPPCFVSRFVQYVVAGTKLYRNYVSLTKGWRCEGKHYDFLFVV